MTRISVMAFVLASAAAQAAPAHQDWVVSHQPDRFIDRVMMEAWADADKGPARMELYCDTENGFRVMFLPHRALMPEGPGQISLTIDGAKPVTMTGDAFGDDVTDVVTLHDSGRLQAALSRAHHVAVRFSNGSNIVGEDAFTLGDLSGQRETLMKTCPVR
ncbi:MAG TPA: hypothetical protein VFI23_00515 [Rhizomicrobium sp.]|nr:hypothetical protein [Rhizomicrobium sp.]